MFNTWSRPNCESTELRLVVHRWNYFNIVSTLTTMAVVNMEVSELKGDIGTRDGIYQEGAVSVIVITVWIVWRLKSSVKTIQILNT